MSIRYINRVGQNFVAASATTVSFTATQAVPIGTLVITAVRGNFTNVVTAVSDTQGNTWIKLDNTTAANTCNVWYCVVTTAFTTSTVVTATYSATNPNSGIAAWAFSGMTAPVTATAIAQGSGVTTLSPANLTVPQYGSLIFSACSINQTTTYTQPSGFTILPTSTTSVALNGSYSIRSSMSAVSTTWSWGLSGNGGVVSASLTPDGGDMLAMF